MGPPSMGPSSGFRKQNYESPCCSPRLGNLDSPNGVHGIAEGGNELSSHFPMGGGGGGRGLSLVTRHNTSGGMLLLLSSDSGNEKRTRPQGI